MLTGCRKSEVLTLCWSDVDLDAGEIHLDDAKAGPRAVQRPPTAVGLLEALPRREDSPWTFPGADRDRRFSGGGLDHAWQTARAAAGLEDVRLHDLRHIFASHALALGGPCPSSASYSGTATWRQLRATVRVGWGLRSLRSNQSPRIWYRLIALPGHRDPAGGFLSHWIFRPP